MRQDILQSFLKFPEVVGVALMQGRVIPYFYIKEKNFSPEQKLELLRVFRTEALKNPSLSSTQEFKVNDYFAYAHKLSGNMNLLTITTQPSMLVRSAGRNLLKDLLQEDVDRTVKAFEQLTRKVLSPEEPSLPTHREPLTHPVEQQGLEEIPDSVEELVYILNEMSKIVCSYLGPKITSNFWQITRPKHEWLNHFQIKSSSAIEFNGPLNSSVTPLQHLFVREWTNAFMNQCITIVRDLPSHIDKAFSDKKYRKMVSIVPSQYLSKVGTFSNEGQGLFD